MNLVCTKGVIELVAGVDFAAVSDGGGAVFLELILVMG